MAGLRCVVLVALLLVACLGFATARRLQSEAAVQQSSEVVAEAPILLGDGTERIIRSQSIRRRGGAVKAVGRAALAQLRTKARFRGTVQELAQHIETDDDLAIDAVNKALMFVCEGLTASAPSEITSGVAPSLADNIISLATAFSLSSRPSATKKIFLDFDGHTLSGSSWNNARNIPVINSLPFDKDGAPGSFSQDELSDIVAIWRAVAEDYAMFDVDVTTADPGAALDGNGVRVLIGGAWSDWYGNAAGGVAYVGQFNAPNLPAFVFAKSLQNNAKFIWEAVSHEVGHTLGLLHDGVKATTTAGATAYYSGQGNWAPIMGSAYYKELTTFDRGEYANSDNPQDDFNVIGGFLAPVPQQFGNDMVSATPLNGTVDAATNQATARVSGIVASAAGDWFSFSANAGSATVSASVLAPWASANRANLDILLTVYDKSGAVLAAINPAGATAAALGVPATAVTLAAAGTFYLSITGAGAGDPKWDGYSNYASRGQYELTVVCTPQAAAPVTPDIQASPSPAPQTPASPSPSPQLPSPSPSPQPPTPPPSAPLRVSAVAMTRAWANTARTQVYCSVSVTFRDLAGNGVAGVKVAGQWALTNSGMTAPFIANTAYVLTSATGAVSFRSGTLSPNAGGSCVFTVKEATLAGYTWDPSISVMSRTITW